MLPRDESLRQLDGIGTFYDLLLTRHMPFNLLSLYASKFEYTKLTGVFVFPEQVNLLCFSQTGEDATTADLSCCG